MSVESKGIGQKDGGQEFKKNITYINNTITFMKIS